MGQSDINLIFDQAHAITISAASQGFYDAAEGLMLTGSTYINPLTDQVWGTAAVFGTDLGIGTEKLPLAVYTGAAAFATLTSMRVQIRAAVDNASGTRAGLAFKVLAQTDDIPVSLLTAQIKIPMPDWPHRYIAAAASNGSVVRFYDLNYLVTGANATAGSIQFAGFMQTRDDNFVGSIGPGFVVGA